MKKYILLLVVNFLWCGTAAPMVKIQTSDDVEFELSKDNLKKLKTLSRLVSDLGEFDDAIPLPNIDSQIFGNIKKALEAVNLQDITKIIEDLPTDQLIKFIAAANYLDINFVENDATIINFFDIAFKKLVDRNISQFDIDVMFANLSEDVIVQYWKESEAYKKLQNIVFSESQGLTIGKVILDSRNFIISPDGKYVISWSSHEGTIKIWEITTGKQVGNDLKHNKVDKIVVSPDSKYVISWSRENEGTIKIWNIATGQQVGNDLKLERDFRIAVSRDGKYVISSSWGKSTVKIWNIATGQQVGNDLEHKGLFGFVVSPDSRYVISWSVDEPTIKIWEITTGKQVGNDLKHNKVDKIVVSPDSRYVISWSKNKGTIKIWDIATGQRVGNDLKHQWVNGIVVSPDSRYVISWSVDEPNSRYSVSWFVDEPTIKIWNIATGQQVGNDLKFERDFRIAVSPDRKYIISSSGQEGTIKIWDISDKNNIQQAGNDLKHQRVNAIVVSPDSRYVISWSDQEGTIKIWNIATGQQVGNDFKNFKFKSIDYIAVSSDSRYLIFGESEVMSHNVDLSLILQLSDLNINQIELFLRVYSALENNEPLMLSLQAAKAFDDLPENMKGFLRKLVLNIDDIALGCVSEPKLDLD